VQRVTTQLRRRFCSIEKESAPKPTPKRKRRKKMLTKTQRIEKEIEDLVKKSEPNEVGNSIKPTSPKSMTAKLSYASHPLELVQVYSKQRARVTELNHIIVCAAVNKLAELVSHPENMKLPNPKSCCDTEEYHQLCEDIMLFLPKMDITHLGFIVRAFGNYRLGEDPRSWSVVLGCVKICKKRMRGIYALETHTLPHLMHWADAFYHQEFDEECYELFGDILDKILKMNIESKEDAASFAKLLRILARVKLENHKSETHDWKLIIQKLENASEFLTPAACVNAIFGLSSKRPEGIDVEQKISMFLDFARDNFGQFQVRQAVKLFHPATWPNISAEDLQDYFSHPIFQDAEANVLQVLSDPELYAGSRKDHLTVEQSIGLLDLLAEAYEDFQYVHETCGYRKDLLEILDTLDALFKDNFDSFAPRTIADVMTQMADLGYYSEELFERGLARISELFREEKPVSVLEFHKILYACARNNHRSDFLTTVYEILEARFADLNESELASLAWSMCVLGFHRNRGATNVIHALYKALNERPHFFTIQDFCFSYLVLLSRAAAGFSEGPLIDEEVFPKLRQAYESLQQPTPSQSAEKIIDHFAEKGIDLEKDVILETGMKIHLASKDEDRQYCFWLQDSDCFASNADKYRGNAFLYYNLVKAQGMFLIPVQLHRNQFETAV